MNTTTFSERTLTKGDRFRIKQTEEIVTFEGIIMKNEVELTDVHIFKKVKGGEIINLTFDKVEKL